MLVYVTRRLREEIIMCSDVEDYVDLSYSFHLKLMLPSIIRGMITIKLVQNKKEIAQLLSIVARARPKILLEIETANGAPFGGRYPARRIPLYTAFAYHPQRIHLLRGDSYNLNDAKQGEGYICDQKLDLISTKASKRILKSIFPFVRNEDIIAFHDIFLHNKKHDPDGIVGVHNFWNRIEEKYKHTDDIVKDWTQGWAEAGVLYVPRFSY
ncbi:MAG: hypothetical protein QXM43_08045 [Desulfurococcaceae archaeon]